MEIEGKLQNKKNDFNDFVIQTVDSILLPLMGSLSNCNMYYMFLQDLALIMKINCRKTEKLYVYFFGEEFIFVRSIDSRFLFDNINTNYNYNCRTAISQKTYIFIYTILYNI